MNYSDSDRIAWGLESLGFARVGNPEEADFVIVNGCVVRQKAEDKVVNKVRSLAYIKKRDPQKIFVLTGCIVGPKVEELKEAFPYVDLFLRPQEWDELFKKAKELAGSGREPSFLPRSAPVSVSITIIKGCNNFCSYCIVPYRRGRERSRPPEEIICEARGLVERGAKEIVLLGQNVDSYGHDLPGRPDLADLLAELEKIEGLKRIRFLTNHPKDMTGKLIETVARSKKVCECIALPVQSGDDEILKLMRRGYTVEQYVDLVRRIREAIPGVAVTTDVIVGFPGETEERYLRTRELIASLRFDKVHIAAYSPRPGTIAARKLPDDVPREEKERRVRDLEKLQEEILAEKNRELVGREVEVLIEGKRKGKWFGRTRTDKLVFIPEGEGDGNLEGEIVKVRIESSSPWSLGGRIISRGGSGEAV